VGGEPPAVGADRRSDLRKPAAATGLELRNRPLPQRYLEDEKSIFLQPDTAGKIHVGGIGSADLPQRCG